MPVVDVPRNEWPEFLDTFSRQHRAWLTTVDQVAGEINPATDAEPRPLGAVTSERDGHRVSAIEIAFAGDSHGAVVRVENPISVRLRTTDEGADRGLEIVDDEGVCTRVRFRAAAVPEMLDGIAPGEQ
jgi:Family of unknown function (DUF5335)